MKLTGLILAAGESRRMGSPKALLTYGGETFLDRLIGVLGQSCSPVVVVLGREAERIRAGLKRAGEATLIVNPEPQRGQLSSLQCGLGAVATDSEGVVFIPVDCPAVRASTVAAIAARFRERQSPELLVIPRHDGKRGHPVCVTRELIPRFLALPPDAQAREVIHGHRDVTAYVDVDDPGILEDIDDPEAFRRLV